jgi:multiple antibiotic resistance protein
MLDLAGRAFLTLFVVIDPVGVAPLFLGLTPNATGAERRRIAGRSMLVAALVLLAFALGGAWFLRQIGISLAAFRVAGGILLFRIAVEMVFAQHERETEAEAAEARVRRDITIFPLAIPLVAGPGALTSVMILAGEAQGAPGLAVVLAMGALVLAMTYVSLLMSQGVARVLGQTGVNVITRVLGILLSALAVQYVADGGRTLLSSG